MLHLEEEDCVLIVSYSSLLSYSHLIGECEIRNF